MNLGRMASLCSLFILIVLNFVLVSYGAFQGNEDLLLQVSTDKESYSAGEPILISLSLVNPTDDVVILTFRNSKVFNGSIWIYGEDGDFLDKIYDAAECVFLPVLTVIEIRPHCSKEILTLNYSSSSLKPGIYKIWALSSDLQSETIIEVHLHTMPEFSRLSLVLTLFLFTILLTKIGMTPRESLGK